MQTKSLCPECLQIITAEIVKKNNQVLIQKNCAKHGQFSDIYWSDAKLYDKFQKYQKYGRNLKNPITKTNRGCPLDCGLCPKHKTATVLANLDVTNRCNQKCPICFANSAQAGYLFEPSIDQIKKMLLLLQREKPAANPAIQFSGGEPTIRQDFIEIIKMAKNLGFSQIQMASNGVTLANNPDLSLNLKKAGLNTVYLQFDGLKEKNYVEIRGYNALPNKIKAIENARKAKLNSVVLVPTIIKGLNDDQIGAIIKFALKNIDTVRGINFQPVSFTGRIDQNKLKNARVTIPDILKSIEKQTEGEINRNDFYPVPFVLPISHFIEAWKNTPLLEFTVHPHCGAATYVFFDNNRIIPITRFMDVEKFMLLVENMASDLENSKIKNIAKIKLINRFARELPKIINKKEAPQNINLIELFINLLKKGTRETLRAFHEKALFIGIMHFQDAYNLDLKRIEQCGVHYVTPDDRLIPFCSYNILYRKEVEKKFAKII